MHASNIRRASQADIRSDHAAKNDTVSRVDTPKKGQHQRKSRPTLRHAPSTQNLWQGSLRHRNAVTLRDKDGKLTSLPKSNSFPSRLRLNEGDSAAAQAKRDAIDGARVVTAVGFGRRSSASKDAIKGLILSGGAKEPSEADFASSMASLKSHKKRPSLVDVFGSRDSIGDDDVGDAPIETATTATATKSEAMPVSTVNAQIYQVKATVKAEEQAYADALLFSQAAEPVLSCNDAVVLRNGGCLEEAGRSSSTIASVAGESASGDASRCNKPGLRKMRSIDALEKALSKMDQSSSARHTGRRPSDAPEAKSWASWRLGGPRRQAEPTLEQAIVEEEQPVTNVDDALNMANGESTAAATAVETEDVPTMEVPEPDVPRPTTPTLFVTSPTATRSPVELSLDGEEFEARSYSSPEHIIGSHRGRAHSRIPRPRRGRMAFEAKAEQCSPTVVRPSAISRSSSRGGGSSKPPLRRKARLSSSSRDSSTEQSNSSHNKGPTLSAASQPSRRRGGGPRSSALASGDQIGSAVGKVSGSEQIRALRRDVLKREGAGSLDSDPDDVFFDLTSAVGTAKGDSVLDFNRKQMAEELEQRRSSAPFGRKQPLADASRSSSSNSNSNSSTRSPASSFVEARSEGIVSRSAGNVLHRKRSGVGMACLFEAATATANKSAASSRSSTPCSDENVAPPDALLDSPTVQAKGKRRGATRRSLERRQAKNDALDMF